MKCPGQDSRYWGGEAIYDVPCPACGAEVEFFKDEPSRRCTGCGYRFRNPRLDIGCAEWCTYAESCFGSMPEEERGPHNNTLDLIAQSVRALAGEEAVQRGMQVVAKAQQLLLEESATPRVVLVASLLQALPKGTDISMLLERGGVEGEEAALVKSVLEGLDAEIAEGAEARLVTDARTLAALALELDEPEASVDGEAVAERFITKGGRKRAQELVGLVAANA